MTTAADTIAYKIVTAADWQSATRGGNFTGSTDDRRDGFIHLSTASQVRETAARHFSAQSGLIVAAIDLAVVADILKWEASRGGALFPHLYGPLPMTAVLWSKPLPVGQNGHHIVPAEVV